jgi:hypothetical protein
MPSDSLSRNAVVYPDAHPEFSSSRALTEPPERSFLPAKVNQSVNVPARPVSVSAGLLGGLPGTMIDMHSDSRVLVALESFSPGIFVEIDSAQLNGF